MDRKLFEEKYNKAESIVQEDERINCELKVLDSNPLNIGIGTRNLVIVMEELAELSQQISKYLRGKEDHLGLVEELADVTMGLDYVKHICNITDKEVNKTINVKLEKLQNTKGSYQ